MTSENSQKAIEYLSSIDGNRIYDTMSYDQFIEFFYINPTRVLRNIFQLFHDMIKNFIGQGTQEYPEDPESINYVHYDCTKLFVEGTDSPFFADRLFANRLMHLVEALKRSAQQNKIYIFRGPPGSGKSTFLNNLLKKFEEFTAQEEGLILRTIWRLDPILLGLERGSLNGLGEDCIEIPCPSYDHPILMIPKSHRYDFFQNMFQGTQFGETLFSKKEYDWLWRDEACTVCSSLYQAVLEKVRDPWKVFEMIYARPYNFNRRLGEGINVFTPGDKPLKQNSIRNPELQKRINTLFKDSNRVKYIFSQYAKTNNGVYALMDIKSHNKTRLMELHNIISEGIHKVEELEESVNSLFLAVMNPEDQKMFQDIQSFEDRIEYIKIPYVMDVHTEVEIYRNIFGNQIEMKFLPGILHHFARVIISTRLNHESPALLEWLERPRKYRRYCDENLHLLKMEIYSGKIPVWLTEDDKNRFTAERRRKIIAEGEREGEKGISGRESIKIFNEFFSKYAKNGKLINMTTLINFFRHCPSDIQKLIPENFLESLVKFYNYNVLQEVKESLYYYNEDRISRDIQNYLFAINFESGDSAMCHYTQEKLDITEEFFEHIEQRLLGAREGKLIRLAFREDTQKKYASNTLPQEILQEKKELCQTKLYQDLYNRYVFNLKENVLDPFLDNENFRRAIKDFESEDFKSYDKRIQEDVTFLINNLCEKFDYTPEGAKEICIHVVDHGLARRFEI